MKQTPQKPVKASAPRTAGGWIHYLPAGRSSVRCRKAGEVWEGEVEVTAATATALQRALADLLKAAANGEPQPFVDFFHEGKTASAWPVRFTWAASAAAVPGVPAAQFRPGVWLRVEFTAAGLAAIEGREVRYFSPHMLCDESGSGPARPVGLPAQGDIGGLVNNPAFRAIGSPVIGEQAIAASFYIAAESGTPTNANTMDNSNDVARKALLALCAKLGMSVSDEATDEELAAAVDGYTPASAAAAAPATDEPPAWAAGLVKDVSDLRTELNETRASAADTQKAALIDAAKRAGKVVPYTATVINRLSVSELQAELNALPVTLPTEPVQAGMAAFTATKPDQLDAFQMEACKRLGITPEEYVKLG